MRDYRLTALQEGPDLVLPACRQELLLPLPALRADPASGAAARAVAPVAAGARCSFVGICRTHRPASAAVSKFSLLESIRDYVGRVVQPMHLEVLKIGTLQKCRATTQKASALESF